MRKKNETQLREINIAFSFPQIMLFQADEGIALNNHQTIHILYNKPRHLKDGLFHIVGFEVFPERLFE